MAAKQLVSLLIVGILSSVLLACLTYFNVAPVVMGVAPWLLGLTILSSSILWLSSFILLKSVQTESILKGLKCTLTVGFSLVFIGISLLSGVYLRNLLAGKLEVHWIIFWPMILVSCIYFWIGMFRKIIRKNVTTFQTWSAILSRKDAEPRAFLKRILDDIIMQKPLKQQSLIRWVRHILIYWGFVLLWLSDMTFAILNDYLPVFGVDQFTLHEHPAKLTLDAFMEFFGLMILAGTSIALIQRYRVRKSPDIVYTDTPTAVFLFVVVVTGYVVEALRLAALPYQQFMAYSFVGNYMASFLRGTEWSSGRYHQAGWIFHAVLASAFIAYFPVKRLIHACASPTGKLMQSQTVLLQKKVTAVVSGLLQNKESSY